MPISNAAHSMVRSIVASGKRDICTRSFFSSFAGLIGYSTCGSVARRRARQCGHNRLRREGVPSPLFRLRFYS